MTVRIRGGVIAAAAALAGVTCSFPEDQSPGIYVTIETPAVVLVNGDQMSVRAHAYRTVNGTPDSGTVDDEELTNVDFDWSTANDQIADVQKDCCGYATLTALDSGHVDITARLAAFQQATTATLPLRVTNFLAVDSVTPPAVQWGGKVTLWGVGVQFATLPQLGGERLLPDTLTYAESLGLSHMEFFVPRPATTGFVGVIGPGIFFAVPNLITVDTMDVYEPNDSIGTPIDLDAPGPYPARAPGLLFSNPALAFEDIYPSWPSFYRQDFYRFTTADTTRAMTFVVKPEHISDTSQLFFYFTDSLEQSGGFWNIPSSGETWLMGQGFGFYICNNEFFFGDEVPAESTIIAFKELPSSVIQNVNFYHNPGNYAMRVTAGYLTQDPRIKADRFEENDLWCKGAEANYARGDSIVISRVRPPFTDTLTIDNPHDVDWYKFKVVAGGPDTVVIRTVARPLPGEADHSDIDLYVYDAPPNFFGQEGSAVAAGSAEDLILVLNPGDYYLGVVDFIGKETRYGLCMTVGTNQPCVAPGMAVSRVSGAPPIVKRPPRAPHAQPRHAPPLNLRTGSLLFRRP